MMTSVQIASVSVSTYPLMIGVGALGMLACTWKRRERFRLTGLQCVFFTLLLTICGITGAKLLFVLENLRDVLENGLTAGGVSFFGSVYLIPLVMPLIGKLFSLEKSQTHDLCAPCVAVMIGSIRIGCLLCGCCGGWVMYVGDFYFAWPTQIMESIGDFVIFFWLMRIETQGSRQGALYPLFMLSYSVLRFFVEFLRYSSEKWLNLAHGHWFALAAVLVAVLWLARDKQRRRAEHTAANEPTKQVIT